MTLLFGFAFCGASGNEIGGTTAGGAIEIELAAASVELMSVFNSLAVSIGEEL
jgi:hypothetical protein